MCIGKKIRNYEMGQNKVEDERVKRKKREDRRKKRYRDIQKMKVYNKKVGRKVQSYRKTETKRIHR